MQKMLLKHLVFTFLFECLSASSCPNESFYWQDYCYFFNSTLTDFQSAETQCISLGGHLTSIHDAFVNNLLQQKGQIYFNKTSQTEFWIGLQRFEDTYFWIDETLLDFEEWARNEPNQENGHDAAIVSLNDGYWKSVDFETPRPFICKVAEILFESTTPIPLKCNHSFIYFEPTNACYGIDKVLDSLTWTQAEHYCWSNFSAHLTSIHNFEEMQFLRGKSAVFRNNLFHILILIFIRKYKLINISEFAYISNSNIWSGAYSENNGKVWEWRDGTRWDYNPWAEGYPVMGAPCGVLTDKRLINVDCNLTKRTICKYYL